MTKCKNADKYKATRTPHCLVAAPGEAARVCDVCAAKWIARTASNPKRLTSNFGLLDVKLGRQRLRKMIEDQKLGVPVQITGTLIGVWSADDGVSMEFEIEVSGVSLGKASARKLYFWERAGEIPTRRKLKIGKLALRDRREIDDSDDFST
jgi:hypothetical protein